MKLNYLLSKQPRWNRGFEGQHPFNFRSWLTRISTLYVFEAEARDVCTDEQNI